MLRGGVPLQNAGRKDPSPAPIERLGIVCTRTMDDAFWAALVTRSGYTAPCARADDAPSVPGAEAQRIAALCRRDPSLFLERHGHLLTEVELAHFDALPDISEDRLYEVRWHLQRLRQTAGQREQTRRNRRFRCLEELASTEYFSDASMQQRAPSLYHQYVGRFVSPSRGASYGKDCVRTRKG